MVGGDKNVVCCGERGSHSLKPVSTDFGRREKRAKQTLLIWFLSGGHPLVEPVGVCSLVTYRSPHPTSRKLGREISSSWRVAPSIAQRRRPSPKVNCCNRACVIHCGHALNRSCSACLDTCRRGGRRSTIPLDSPPCWASTRAFSRIRRCSIRGTILPQTVSLGRDRRCRDSRGTCPDRD